jgi:hypothetical protein
MDGVSSVLSQMNLDDASQSLIAALRFIRVPKSRTATGMLEGQNSRTISGSMIAGCGSHVKKKHNSRYVFGMISTRYGVCGISE